MNENISDTQHPDTLENWLAQHLHQLRISELWPLVLDRDASDLQFARDSDVMHGTAKRNRQGITEELKVEIHRQDSETWKVVLPDGPLDIDFLGLIEADFSFPELPSLEKRYCLPQVKNQIDLRHLRDPDLKRTQNSQMGCAGPLAADGDKPETIHPCELEFDEHSLEYCVTSGSLDLWFVIELVFTDWEGEPHTIQAVHQMMPYEASGPGHFVAKGQFDKTVLFEEASSDVATVRIRQVETRDLHLLKRDQKQQVLAEQSDRMMVLPELKQTVNGFEYRDRRPEKKVPYHLHVACHKDAEVDGAEKKPQFPPPMTTVLEKGDVWKGFLTKHYLWLVHLAKGKYPKLTEATILDLVQEALLRILKQFQNPGEIDSDEVRGLLVNRLRQSWIDRFRKKTNQESVLGVNSDGESVADSILAREDAFIPDPGQIESHDVLHHAIGKLEPQLQRVVELLYWEGLKAADIAREIGKSSGHVSRMIKSAREKLKDFLPPDVAE